MSKEKQALKRLQSIEKDELSNVAQVGERFDWFKFYRGKFLDPNRSKTRRPGMLNNGRVGL